jgi:hypothetical protein
VAALGELVEVDEILVGALGPTPRSVIDLFRDDADGCRNGDGVVVEEGALVFLIETSAGRKQKLAIISLSAPAIGAPTTSVIPSFHEISASGSRHESVTRNACSRVSARL